MYTYQMITLTETRGGACVARSEKGDGVFVPASLVTRLALNVGDTVEAKLAPNRDDRSASETFVACYIVPPDEETDDNLVERVGHVLRSAPDTPMSARTIAVELGDTSEGFVTRVMRAAHMVPGALTAVIYSDSGVTRLFSGGPEAFDIDGLPTELESK